VFPQTKLLFRNKKVEENFLAEFGIVGNLAKFAFRTPLFVTKMFPLTKGEVKANFELKTAQKAKI
jgi:hypothetical protein